MAEISDMQIESFLKDHLEKIPDEIINSIKKNKKIAVIGHKDPDGDSVASQLALVQSLNSHGWNCDAINEGPYNIKYIKLNKKFFKNSIEKKYDSFIIVDTPGIDRIGLISKDIDFEKAVLIDHHVSNKGFSATNWIDDIYISTSEMIFLLLYKLGFGLENKTVCQNLLTGIISDTYIFNHIRINKHLSLLIAYFLISNGADPKESYKVLFQGNNLGKLEILSLALQRLKSVKKGKILWTYVTHNDRKKHKNASIDTASIFRNMLSVAGVDISILFKVYKDKIDISFRSYNIDVSKLAVKLGGGGHREAAGISVKGDFEKVRESVLKTAADYL